LNEALFFEKKETSRPEVRHGVGHHFDSRMEVAAKDAVEKIVVSYL